jgi:hypothetical protein
VNKVPVECITVMNNKEITPLRIRFEDDAGAHVVKIDRILQRDKKTVFPTMNKPRSTEHTFRCEVVQGGCRKSFSLIFNDQTCRWYMYAD